MLYSRYLIVTRKLQELSMTRAWVLIALAFTVSVSQYIQDPIIYSPRSISREDNTTCMNASSPDYSKISERTQFWYKFIFSIISLLILVTFTSLLIHVIVRTRQRHERIVGDGRENSYTRQAHRTTAILVAIGICTVVTKFVYLVNINSDTSIGFYLTIAFFDINSGLNLCFYMTSQEFRDTFHTLLKKSISALDESEVEVGTLHTYLHDDRITTEQGADTRQTNRV